ncbi:MAG TPA: YhdP family protein [Steroidobacteraceae bacterium]|nr:YhdP family protein [Steroidobacteraceae bacterium]
MRLRRLARILGVCAAATLALVLSAMLALKLAIDRAPRYQADIRAWVFRQTGLHVRFTQVAPALRWYGPELSFRDLELRSGDDRRVLARAARGRIGLDVWRLLSSGRLFAPRIDLDSPDIVIARRGPTGSTLAAEIASHGTGANAVTFDLNDLPPGILSIRHGRLTVTGWNRRLPRLVLGDVDVLARRDAGAVHLRIDARLPRALGGALRLRGEIDDLGASGPPRWTATLATQGVSFAGWRQLLPEYLGHLRSGTGGFDFTASGAGIDLAHATFDFSAVEVVARATGGSLDRFDRIAGDLQLTHEGDRWTLLGRNVQVRRAGRVDPPSQFDVTWRGVRGGGLVLRAHAGYLRADSLLPLAALLPRNSTRSRLIALAPSGQWSDASLSLAHARFGAPWRFSVRAHFHDAGFAAFGQTPGVHGLSGVVQGDQDAGHIVLASQSLRVDWPAQWPKPIGFGGLEGTVYWSRTPQGVLIATPRLSLTSPDGNVAVLAALRLPDTGRSPTIDLVARLRDGNLVDAHRYLPQAKLHPKTIAWLDRAFIAGRVADAEVVVRGPVRHFPFRDGSGLFLARADVDGVALHYGPGWPAMQNAAARVEFRDQGMSVRMLRARIDGLPILSGEARIADFRAAVLSVRAATGGNAAAALKFLRDSPIERFAHGGFSDWQASGAYRARVRLMFPFKDFAHRRVVVQARLNGVALSRVGLPLTADDLRGDFTVDRSAVVAADITGRLLGGPVRIAAAKARGAALPGTRLEFSGVAHGAAIGAAIGAALGRPLEGRIGGTTAWRATLTLLAGPAGERTLRIATDLRGLALGLPRPLTKPSARPMPSSAELRWSVGSAPKVDFALGSVARGALQLRRTGTGERIARAAIAFGDAIPRFSDRDVLDVRGRIGRIDLAGWRRLLPSGGHALRLSKVLRTARLRIAEADYEAYALREVDLRLAALGDRWRLTLSGPNADGTILIPAAGVRAAPWDASFANLDVTAPTPDPRLRAARAANAPPRIEPSKLPTGRIHVGHLVWLGRKLGALDARVSGVADGLVLDDLTITGSSFAARMHGDWRGAGTGAGRLAGSLTSRDVENTMADLGYERVIAAKSGRVDFDLRWNGAPTIDAFREAAGQVKVALVNGQVFGIKPGAGRVFGLASIAALPRRLALDFSDLTDKGLAFDTVGATFELHGGNAYTNDVLLKGPAAAIGVVGRIGLKNRDYDQIAVVTTSLGNSLPLAGALAGGPVVGAAVLLFTEVFKQPLKGLARGYYHVTGSWADPKVQRIDRATAAAAIARDGKK